MTPVCHPDRPHAARRLCRVCYNASYARRKRLDELSNTLLVWIDLRKWEKERQRNETGCRVDGFADRNDC